MINQIPDESQLIDIKVPSIVVNEQSGSELINDVVKASAVEGSNSDIGISVAFELVQTIRPEVVYKFDLNDYELYQSIFGLQKLFPTVKQNIFIVPAYNIGSQEQMKKKPNMYCLNHLKYCQQRPDNMAVEKEADQPLLESIRQLCLSRTNIEYWWSYTTAFFDKCLTFDENTRVGSLVTDLGDCSNRCLESMLEKVEAQQAIG